MEKQSESDKEIELFRKKVEQDQEQYQIKIDELDNQIAKFKFWANSCIYVGLGIALLGAIWFYCHSTKEVPFRLNEYGDFLGGGTGSMWALAGLIYIYIAFLGQKQQLLTQQIELLHNRLEIKESRGVLEGQRSQLEKQNETQQIQKFESALYSMLDIYNGIMNSFSKEESGKNYFIEIKTKLYDIYNFSPIPEYNKISYSGVNTYISFYDKNKDDLSHYLRVLYRIFKFIDQSNILSEEEKWFYTKTVRALLSEAELFILYYNSLTNFGENFRELISKYNLTKHLPITDKMEIRRFNYYLKESKTSTKKRYYKKDIPIYNVKKLITMISISAKKAISEPNKTHHFNILTIYPLSYAVSSEAIDNYLVFKIITDTNENDDLVGQFYEEMGEEFSNEFPKKNDFMKKSKLYVDLLKDLLFIIFTQETLLQQKKEDIAIKGGSVFNKNTDTANNENYIWASIERVDKQPLKLLSDKY